MGDISKRPLLISIATAKTVGHCLLCLVKPDRLLEQELANKEEKPELFLGLRNR